MTTTTQGASHDEALGAQGEAHWARLREQLERIPAFWLGLLLAPSPRDVLTVRRRVTRLLDAEGRRLVIFTPPTPEALRALPDRLLDDREVGRAACTWIEALHADAPGTPGAPWSTAWEAFFRRLDEHCEDLRRTLLGGLLIAAPPVIAPHVPEAAPDLWSIRGPVIELPARPAGRPSAPPPPPRGSRLPPPPTSEVDPDTLLALEGARLQRWAAAHRPSPDTATTDPAADPVSGADIARARALVRAAEGFLRRGRLQDGRDAAEEACSMLRGRGDVLDETHALATLARIEHGLGDIDRAEVHIHKALAGRSAMPIERVPPEWYDLAGSLACERRDFLAAASFLELSLTALRARRRDESSETLAQQAEVHEKIGDAHARAGNHERAARAFGESLLIRRRACAAEGDDPDALAVVSYALKRLGDAEVSSGNLVGAVASLREAVAIERRVLRYSPADPEAIYQLADALWRLGDVLGATGDDAAAAAISDEATLLLAGAAPPAGPPSRRRPRS